MQVHAKISKEWRQRMIFLGCMFYGLALWFFYDGVIAWPAEAERHEQFARIAEEQIAAGRATDEKDPVIERAWQRYAAEHELKTKVPKERTPGDISGQMAFGGSIFVIGILFTLWVLWNHRLSIRAEGDLVIGANGQKVPLDSIVAVDRRKWQNKGIAYAIYEENGRRRRLTLDDHKFLGAEAIILEAERRIAARAGEAAPGDVDVESSD